MEMDATGFRACNDPVAGTDLRYQVTDVLQELAERHDREAGRLGKLATWLGILFQIVNLSCGVALIVLSRYYDRRCAGGVGEAVFAVGIAQVVAGAIVCISERWVSWRRAIRSARKGAVCRRLGERFKRLVDSDAAAANRLHRVNTTDWDILRFLREETELKEVVDRPIDNDGVKPTIWGRIGARVRNPRGRGRGDRSRKQQLWGKLSMLTIQMERAIQETEQAQCEVDLETTPLGLSTSTHAKQPCVRIEVDDPPL